MKISLPLEVVKDLTRGGLIRTCRRWTHAVHPEDLLFFYVLSSRPPNDHPPPSWHLVLECMTGRRTSSLSRTTLLIVEFRRRIRDHLYNRASISLVNKSNSSFVVLGEGLQRGKKPTLEITVFTLLSAGPFLKALLVFLRSALLVRVASCLGVSAWSLR